MKTTLLAANNEGATAADPIARRDLILDVLVADLDAFAERRREILKKRQQTLTLLEKQVTDKRVLAVVGELDPSKVDVLKGIRELTKEGLAEIKEKEKEVGDAVTNVKNLLSGKKRKRRSVKT